MNERETIVLKRIHLALSQGDTRLFRNNVGQAFVGKILKVSPRRIIIDDYRVVRFGLAEHSADLIGFKSRVITPAMVGQSVAVFASVEVKSASNRLSSGQRAWADMIMERGGIAGVAHSVTEAMQLVNGADG